MHPFLSYENFFNEEEDQLDSIYSNEKIITGGMAQINRFLINECGYDPVNSKFIGISPETRCLFFKSIKYPEIVDAGLKVKKLGSSSVIYDISLFCKGEQFAAAEGHFVHVFVTRLDQKKTVKIPSYITEKFKCLL